jgi:hypothetical protein
MPEAISLNPGAGYIAAFEAAPKLSQNPARITLVAIKTFLKANTEAFPFWLHPNQIPIFINDFGKGLRQERPLSSGRRR